MYQLRDFGLSCAMLPGADFEIIAKCAGRAGLGSITARPALLQAALAAGHRVEDLQAILAENKLTVSELDPFCAWMEGMVEPGNIAAPFFNISESEFFETADMLGARNINIIYALDEPLDLDRAVDAILGVCGRAQKHGVLISLEFLPWSEVGTIQTAAQIAKRVDRPNFGINIDFWHHVRSGGAPEDIKSIPANHIAAVQISDVIETPMDHMILETATSRLMPGHGHGHVRRKLDILYEKGIKAPVTLEVFNAEIFSTEPDDLADNLRRNIENLIGVKSRYE